MEQGLQVLLQVFGGLALFLYGTDSLCRAVQQGAGRRLRSLLARCTANPVVGLLTGAAVTAVLVAAVYAGFDGICCCFAGYCSVWPAKTGGAAAWARRCSVSDCCSRASR